ncbi:MAG TPA: HEAT repeat domain-containing protein [Candidatus Binatia bacterium]|jgi:HEAT repeat protein|nr:HEAT repeat domain-containing protein [Candidatus Binatia bacterium]
MWKRVQIALAVLLVGLLGVLGWQVFRSREPVYEGKRLSAWLKDLDDQHPGPVNDHAIEAIRYIGRDAVPQIISSLRTRDSSLKQKLLKWASEHHLVKSVYTPVSENHHRAVLACNALGPDAKPAIPALVALLNDGYASGYVGAALGRIGPEAIVPLIGSLTNSNVSVRVEVAHSLANFRRSDPIVVPTLIQCLNDKSSFVRSLAANSLGRIGQEPTVAIPALVLLLNDGDPQVRWNACLAIAEFKQQAQSARTPLFASLGDPDPSVRGTAAIALARIEPENASSVEKVMPYLIEDLEGFQGSNVKFPLNFRYPAIQALGECGKQSQPAVPALLECLKAAEPYMQEAAARSLKAIDPEAAAKAGVK